MSINAINILYDVAGFTLMMGIIIFVHEWGHYYVARLCGVRVETFSIGFGKKIFNRRDKNGCIWAVSIIPLGGYVKFFGDKSEISDVGDDINTLTDTEKKQTFYHKNLWQKLAIVLAGPFINIFLAFFLLIGIYFFNGIIQVTPIIEDTVKQMPAAEIGLKKGDKIIAVNGEKTASISDVQGEIIAGFGQPVAIDFLRGEQKFSAMIRPLIKETPDGEKIPMVGILFSNDVKNMEYTRYDALKAIQTSSEQVMFVTKVTYRFLVGLFKGTSDPKQLSGPIKMGDMAGNALQQDGALFFMHLIAMVSLGVGLTNLIPLPMLDGGHVVFYFYEMIARRKPAAWFQEYAFKFGFIVIMMMMGFTIINDLGIF